MVISWLKFEKEAWALWIKYNVSQPQPSVKNIHINICFILFAHMTSLAQLLFLRFQAVIFFIFYFSGNIILYILSPTVNFASLLPSHSWTLSTFTFRGQNFYPVCQAAFTSSGRCAWKFVTTAQLVKILVASIPAGSSQNQEFLKWNLFCKERFCRKEDVWHLSGQNTLVCAVSRVSVCCGCARACGYVCVYLCVIPRELKNKSNRNDGGQSPLSCLQS